MTEKLVDHSLGETPKLSPVQNHRESSPQRVRRCSIVREVTDQRYTGASNDAAHAVLVCVHVGERNDSGLFPLNEAEAAIQDGFSEKGGWTGSVK